MYIYSVYTCDMVEVWLTRLSSGEFHRAVPRGSDALSDQVVSIAPTLTSLSSALPSSSPPLELQAQSKETTVERVLRTCSLYCDLHLLHCLSRTGCNTWFSVVLVTCRVAFSKVGDIITPAVLATVSLPKNLSRSSPSLSPPSRRRCLGGISCSVTLLVRNK